MYVCAQHGHVFLDIVQHWPLMCVSSDDAVVNPRLGSIIVIHHDAFLWM